MTMGSIRRIEKIGPMYKTGGEIFDILQIIKEKLGVEYRPSKSSLMPGETYRHKIYAFSWFMSINGELVYIIEDLDTDNKKEEDKEMTKEEALKKIDELKEYVEKCEEKEKESPEMPRHDFYNIRLVVPDKPHNQHVSWDGSFETQKSADLYNILAFELANIIYVRDYLGIKDMDITESLLNVWYIWFSPADKLYHWSRFPSTLLLPHMRLNKVFTIWCFTDEQDAIRVYDYMNKYVKDVKRNMY